MSDQISNPTSRRQFLKAGTVVAATGATLQSAIATRAYAGGSDILKVGLVGSGGRGSGAALNALQADPGARLTAIADIDMRQINDSISNFKANADLADKVTVEDQSKFVGLDAYKSLIDAVDVVILATPPGFRPVHLKYAVAAGKHIFTEKPMATDAPGVRSVLQSIEIAKQKKIALVAGFCWRYDYPRRALFQKLHEGAIGDIVAVYGTYLTGPVKPMLPADKRPAEMTDLEWMVRNWYNFTWLSGDGLVEQAIHTVDWLGWTMKDVPPEKCTAVGGRQSPALGGNIYDHIEVNYVWEGGTRGFLAQRQIPGCHNDNSLYVIGTKGQGTITGRGVAITGETNWRYDGPKPNMYDVEHNELFKSIRDGNPINDGDRMVKSTLMGIMGRMAGYTGQEITWDMAMKSEEVLVPEIEDWNMPAPEVKMAQPGVTQFM